MSRIGSLFGVKVWYNVNDVLKGFFWFLCGEEIVRGILRKRRDYFLEIGTKGDENG